jgi:SAM-dependent methyltransferase
MNAYAIAYRLGLTPWERYLTAAAESIGSRLDREEAERPRPPGRALDLGCGRGLYTRELARRGWEAVGIDNVARAVDAANRARVPGATFLLGDVTLLREARLGTFDFFLDVGCFQGLGAPQRGALGAGVSALANPGATLLMLAFQPVGVLAHAGAATRAQVEAALPDWFLLSVEPGDTSGLGWPLNRTSPQWYRLRRRD